MEIKRRKTRIISVGNIAIGGGNPVSIQSMTKTDTRDVHATVRQIHELEKAGCEIIRVAVPDNESADALPYIIKKINIPLIADIHFDRRLAVRAIRNGAHGIRINPGNIGGKEKIAEIVKAAEEKNVPIRIGVNSGSLSNKWIERYKGITPEALVNSALEYIKIFEDIGFNNLKISIKAPDIQRTIESYRLISKKTDYPLHIGVTEAGPLLQSAVMSSIALGALLMEGIGDTIRVSVTGKPQDEVIIAKEILQSLGTRQFSPQIISCPTCGRCKVDLIKIVSDLDKELSNINWSSATRLPKAAVMGCIVNGPGEAKEADIGIACGKGEAVLFKNGVIIKKIKEREIADELIKGLRALSSIGGASPLQGEGHRFEPCSAHHHK